MNSPALRTWRSTWVALRVVGLATVTLGVAYALVILAVGQWLLPSQANGSLLRNGEGTVVGSSLLGQSFTDEDGAPLAQYFQPRPSSAGGGYDGASSSGSNAGPENPDLIAAIEARRAEIAAFNGVTEAEVPADAVTGSGSGLDPHISPAYAAIQVSRVAESRGIPVEDVRELVASATTPPLFGFIGGATVNVVTLNAALDAR